MEKFRLRVSFGRNAFIILLLGGVAIREVFAPFTGHPYDFELWVRLGYYVSQGSDPYHQYPPVAGLSFPSSSFDPTWPGYPPLWPLFLALVYKVYLLVGMNNRYLYYFMIKQCMIWADVGVSILIFKLVRSRSSVTNATKAYAFWLFCPYTILISSIWGMFDQTVLFFVLLGAYFIFQEKAARSASLEAVSVALKLIPSIYIPFFAGIQTSRKRIIAYSLTAASLSALFALFPYVIFRNWSLPFLVGVGLDVTNKFGHTLNYWEVLNNYWGLTDFPVPAGHATSLRFVGLVWIPLILLATYFCVRKAKLRGQIDVRVVTFSLLFITLVFFLTKLTVNEQYVTYFLGFGVFDYYVIANESRRRLFHAIWIVTLVELGVNNAFFLGFLEPISPYYTSLSNYFYYGALDPLRLTIMTASAVIFSTLSALYLYSMYQELNREVSLKEASGPNHAKGKPEYSF